MRRGDLRMWQNHGWTKIVLFLALCGTADVDCTLPALLRGTWVSPEKGLLNMTSCNSCFNPIIAGTAYGACTLPALLRGMWISSEKGPLNFTSDTVWDYPLQVTATVTHITFTCLEQSGDKYLLKASSSFLLFGFNFVAYLCIEFHQISQHKYWYQIGNTIEATTLQRVFVRLEGVDVDLATGCNRPEPYGAATFNTLVKEGSFELGLIEATCPFDLFHTYAGGSLASVDGGTSCTNTTLNVCEDRTIMKLTYDPTCAATLKIASDGVNVCLLDHTDATSGVTYLHVWNNDSTLAMGVNRINCYAFQTTGSGMVATLYPGACLETQNATRVTDPGIVVRYNTITETCQNQVEGGPQTIYYVAIVLGALLVIFLIALLVFVIYKTRCRCITKLCRKSRIGHSEASLTSSSDDDAMRAYRNSRRKDIPGVFVARKPIKLGPIIEPYLQPPAKVELLYEVIPRPTSSKVTFNRSLFSSQQSLKWK